MNDREVVQAAAEALGQLTRRVAAAATTADRAALLRELDAARLRLGDADDHAGADALDVFVDVLWPAYAEGCELIVAMADKEGDI